jgi:hypothetical protein
MNEATASRRWPTSWVCRVPLSKVRTRRRHQSQCPPTIPFADPDPFQELRYSSVLAGKLAIADYLGRPLAKLSAEDRGYINALLEETLDRRTVITCVRGYFRDRADQQATHQRQGEGEHAG